MAHITMKIKVNAGFLERPFTRPPCYCPLDRVLASMLIPEGVALTNPRRTGFIMHGQVASTVRL